MKPYDVFIAYVSWRGGGKSRPVLVIKQDVNDVYVYSITTQFKNKSKAIKDKFFKINNWKEAGLEKQSYIDTGTVFNLPLNTIQNKQPIGKLTSSDIKGLKEFLSGK